MWRLFQHSLREQVATRGEAMEMVNCRLWSTYLGLSLRECRGGAGIKIIMIMIRQNNND